MSVQNILAIKTDKKNIVDPISKRSSSLWFFKSNNKNFNVCFICLQKYAVWRVIDCINNLTLFLQASVLTSLRQTPHYIVLSHWFYEGADVHRDTPSPNLLGVSHITTQLKGDLFSAPATNELSGLVKEFHKQCVYQQTLSFFWMSYHLVQNNNTNNGQPMNRDRYRLLFIE